MRSRLDICCKPYRIGFASVVTSLFSAWTCRTISKAESLVSACSAVTVGEHGCAAHIEAVSRNGHPYCPKPGHSLTK